MTTTVRGFEPDDLGTVPDSLTKSFLKPAAAGKASVVFTNDVRLTRVQPGLCL